MRRWMVMATTLLVASMTMIRAQEDFDPFDPLDDDAQTGLVVGARIPDFQAMDQHGELVDFEGLKGPNGAMLLFHRSADW